MRVVSNRLRELAFERRKSIGQRRASLDACRPRSDGKPPGSFQLSTAREQVGESDMLLLEKVYAERPRSQDDVMSGGFSRNTNDQCRRLDR